MKKVALIAFGIADGYCHQSSSRLINIGPELFSRIKETLKNSGKTLGAYVAVNNPADSFDHVNVLGLIPETKIINFKLCINSFLHPNNEITLTDFSGEKLLFDGDKLDFMLRPQDYDIHICGIDINGIFVEAIDQLLDLGFDVTIYSDLIKPFSKKTINHIRSSNVKFVSAKSVCLK